MAASSFPPSTTMEAVVCKKCAGKGKKGQFSSSTGMGLFTKDCSACGGSGKFSGKRSQSMVTGTTSPQEKAPFNRASLPTPVKENSSKEVDAGVKSAADVAKKPAAEKSESKPAADVPKKTPPESAGAPPAPAPEPTPALALEPTPAPTPATPPAEVIAAEPPVQEPPAVAPVPHEKVTWLLSNRPALKDKVKHFHGANASNGLLDLAGLRKFCAEIGNEFDVPAVAFGDLEDTYARFDFDGSGALDLHETYCCVKACLIEFRKSVGLAPAPSVPFMTPEEGGYTVIRVLASGGQGTASLVRDKSGSEVVLKTYSRENENAGGLEELIDEAEHMKMVNAHEHVAHCLNVFQDKENLYMISGANRGGDWQNVQNRAADQGVSLTENWYRTLFQQAFEGLSHMHRHAIMHCDIKEPNLMLKTQDFHSPNVVIIDLGLSHTFPAAQDICGTPGYIPPETWSAGKWFPKGDIFSMGVVCLQLLTGKIPAEDGDVRGIFTEGCQDMEDVQRVTRDKAAPIDEAKTATGPASAGLCELLGRCLDKGRAERPRAPQVLAHSWFAGASAEATLEEPPTFGAANFGAPVQASLPVVAEAPDDGDDEPSAKAPALLRPQFLGGDTQTAAQAIAQMLPPGPRICILGGTKFQNHANEALVAAVAERLAASLAGKVVVLTGGMPGVQAAFARAFGSSEFLVHLLPEGQASDFGVGRDVRCGATLDERMDIFGLLGDVYITFEGGPGVAKEARAAFERGALVLPLISTGGASAGMFDFPSGALVKPSDASDAQWACLTEKVSPKQAASGIVALVSASLKVVAARASILEDVQPAQRSGAEQNAADGRSAREAEAAGSLSVADKVVAYVAIGIIAFEALQRLRRRR